MSETAPDLDALEKVVKSLRYDHEKRNHLHWRELKPLADRMEWLISRARRTDTLANALNDLLADAEPHGETQLSASWERRIKELIP